MKPLFQTQLNNITTYNQNVTTLETNVVELTSQFSNLTEAIEIIIDQDGTYNLSRNNENVSKFVKLTINSGVTCEIYDYNISNDEETQIDMQINIMDNANVYYLNLDRLAKAQINRDITVGENTTVEYHTVSLNQDANENKVVANINGANSTFDYKLITVASNETHNIFDTCVNNNAPYTKANIWQKAVAKTGGKNEFLATGHIAKGCDKAENYQESRVLLLDEAAKGDASPLLLIDHYDVLAGHAAGVSRVNQEELYYLQTRGITLNEAEKLMTIAFVKPLIDAMKSEDLQVAVLNEITESLGK